MKKINWNYLFPVITVVLLGSFMWAIHNSFIPIQEGWMQYYSLLTQKGMLPYRDFYFFTQPISLFIDQIILKLGGGYILYRYYGMAERIILILVLYYLIEKHFSPTATFIAVVTSAFLYQSFNIDIFYTYYQTTLLFFLLSLICLQRASKSRFSWLYNCFVGIFGSLAFFTKQSSGLVVSLFLLFMMIWYTPRKSLLPNVSSYLLGWGIPASLIIGWLVQKHIFYEYLSQVFGGISSKGSFLDILFGFWNRNYALLYLGLFIIAFFIGYVLYRKKIIVLNNLFPTSLELTRFNYLLLFFYPLFIIGGFILLPDLNMATTVSSLDIFLLFWVYFPFYLLLISTFIIGIKWISRKQILGNKQLVILILASFFWTYSVGLSGQLELYSSLLGTALVLAFLLDRINLKWKHFQFIVITASCLLLFVVAAKKHQMPYNWWGWSEYGHEQNAVSIIPDFKNFKLSPKTVRVYDRIYLDIKNNTTSNDYVYTYPFMALFNFVTDRRQPTFAPVDYFDVCPDEIAISDAEILRKNPPKMIVYMRIPEKAYKYHEDIFRNGQVSGQRNIDAAINDIVKEYDYKMIDFFLSEGWNWPIYVYIRQ